MFIVTASRDNTGKIPFPLRALCVKWWAMYLAKLWKRMDGGKDFEAIVTLEGHHRYAMAASWLAPTVEYPQGIQEELC